MQSKQHRRAAWGAALLHGEDGSRDSGTKPAQIHMCVQAATDFSFSFILPLSPTYKIGQIECLSPCSVWAVSSPGQELFLAVLLWIFLAEVDLNPGKGQHGTIKEETAESFSAADFFSLFPPFFPGTTRTPITFTQAWPMPGFCSGFLAVLHAREQSAFKQTQNSEDEEIL